MIFLCAALVCTAGALINNALGNDRNMIICMVLMIANLSLLIAGY